MFPWTEVQGRVVYNGNELWLLGGQPYNVLYKMVTAWLYVFIIYWFLPRVGIHSKN